MDAYFLNVPNARIFSLFYLIIAYYVTKNRYDKFINP